MEKIIFLAAGSKSDPGFGGTYDRKELSNRGITVTEPLFIESCHGCPDLMKRYSEQTQELVEEGHRVVGVMQGGLYFALPSFQATQVTYPIISVPLDKVAYQGFMVPTGNAVISTVGIEKKTEKGYTTTQRENALSIAENILNLETDSVDVRGDEDNERLLKELDKLGIEISERSDLMITYGSSFENGLDKKKVQVWADTVSGPNDICYVNPESFLSNATNTVQVRGDKNAAIYAAKILSLQRDDLKDKIIEMGVKKRESYEERNLLKELGF